MTEKQGFWTSLPGILAGIAAVVTALTGLYVAVLNFTPETSDDNNQGEEKVVINNEITTTETPYQDPRLLSKQQIEELKTEESKALRQLNKEDFKTFPKTGPLLMCENFPTENSVDSLMSWSNHYHKNIINPRDYQPKHACDKTIAYRARAHCKQPENAEIRQSLLETLVLCRKIGFEWHQVTAQ
jgi:hypothetical protein